MNITQNRKTPALKCLILVLSLFISFLSCSAWANLPYHPIQFPRDDAAHHDNVPYPVKNMTEWWYYNGQLTTKSGRHFGYYLFFFNAYQNKSMLPGFYIQLTDIDNKKVYGKKMFFFNKKNISLSTQKLDLKYGKDLTLQKNQNTYLLNTKIKGSYKQPPFALSLQFTPTRAVLLASKTGLIDMRNDTNSYYYSFSNLLTNGYIQIGDERLEIDPKQSLSWMDHQWGDFILTPGYQWMWASIQLQNGLEMDLAAGMDPKTKKIIPAWANIIMPNNSRIYLTNPQDFSYQDRGLPKGEKHPLTYDLIIPSIDLKLTMDAYVPGQNVNGIWEGISSVKGTLKGKPVTGQATTENTIRY